MPQCFTEWTVLPHDPIEKHSDNLWSVSGKMPSGNQRRMAIVRRADGKLVIHNPVALNDDAMREIEAFGSPAYLVVPNAFHRMDSIIYKQRYPGLEVLCPQTARKRVGEIVPVSGNMDEMPKDGMVDMFHLRGMKEREGVLVVRSNGKSALVFNDALLNVPARSGLMGFMMAPTGLLAVPRFTRWLLTRNAGELKEHLAELSSVPDLTHLVPGHGAVVETNVKTQLMQAAQRL